MSDNSDGNEEGESRSLDLRSSSTIQLPSEDKDLTNLKTLAHLSPRITPDLDDPMAGKPRWKEFRFSFLMWLIARGLMDAFIRNGYDEDEVDAEDRVEGITIDNKLGDPSETGKCLAGEQLPFHDVEFRCRQIWYHMLPSDNPWHQALIRSSGTVVAMADELDKIYLTRDDVTATEAQQEWSSFRWKIGIDMAIFNREWLRLTSEHASHNGELSPKAIYVQYKAAVTSQNKHCPADGDDFFYDAFDRRLSRIERRNAEIARKDLKILYGDVLTAYRRKVRSGKYRGRNTMCSPPQVPRSTLLKMLIRLLMEPIFRRRMILQLGNININTNTTAITTTPTPTLSLARKMSLTGLIFASVTMPPPLRAHPRMLTPQMGTASSVRCGAKCLSRTGICALRNF